MVKWSHLRIGPVLLPVQECYLITFHFCARDRVPRIDLSLADLNSTDHSSLHKVRWLHLFTLIDRHCSVQFTVQCYINHIKSQSWTVNYSSLFHGRVLIPILLFCSRLAAGEIQWIDIKEIRIVHVCAQKGKRVWSQGVNTIRCNIAPEVHYFWSLHIRIYEIKTVDVIDLQYVPCKFKKWLLLFLKMPNLFCYLFIVYHSYLSVHHLLRNVQFLLLRFSSITTLETIKLHFFKLFP